jgi:hypothetical protein
MNFNKMVRFLRTISNDPDLGRVAYNHEYTPKYIKISSFKSLIYMNYFYIFTEILILKTILVFKTYAVDLRRLLTKMYVSKWYV